MDELKSIISQTEAHVNQQNALLELLNSLQNYYKENKNDIGFSYFTENLQIGKIIVQNLGLGFSAVSASLLFRAFENKIIDENDIKKTFDSDTASQIIKIIKGLKEINQLDNEGVFGISVDEFEEKKARLSKRSKKFAKTLDEYLNEQGEYFKHFYIAMSSDVRAILLKLAYHYYKVLNIKLLDEQKRFITNRESRYLFAPMAHQLSLYNMKTTMEETAMKYLNSDIYQYIARILTETKDQREKYIQNFIRPVKKAMQDIGIKAIIKGRPKSIHSIWNKMKKQNVGIDKIYDLFAIRIIITNEFKSIADEKAACWQVYSKITDYWQPNPNRLKDWISAPKPSGYESLHTTVIGPDGRWVEVQIRTKRMDDIAEKGNAAHWKYKEIREVVPAKKEGKNAITWIEMLRNALENPEQFDSQSEQTKAELYSGVLFVYTPAKELKKLNANATVLDFAYKIHTQIGNHCVGAKINGKLAGIRETLKNGDVVEILTSAKQTPKAEWLDIVVSNDVKSRIKRALREQEAIQIQQGKDILNETVDKLLKNYEVKEFSLDMKKLTRLRKYFEFNRLNDFYIAIAKSEISIDDKFLYDLFIKPESKSYQNIIEQLNEQIVTDIKTTDSDFLIVDDTMTGIQYEFSKCCNPIPGDKIFAFVTATRGTKIHRIDCPNAKDLIKKYPYRIMKATWKSQVTSAKFRAKIKFISEQRPNIVAQISNVIAKQAYVEPFDIKISETSNNTYNGFIGIWVNGNQYVQEFISKLKSINGMLTVERLL